MPDSSFFQSFQKLSKQEWQELLGDASNRNLTLSPNIEVPVFIHETDALTPPPITQKGDNDWNIVVTITVKSEKDANTQALQALEGGADELIFVLAKKVDWSTLLKGVELPMIHTSLEVKTDIMTIVADLGKYISQKGWDKNKLKGSFLRSSGTWSHKDLKQYLKVASADFPKFSLLNYIQDSSMNQIDAFVRLFQEVDSTHKITKDKNLRSKMRFRLLAGKNIINTIATIRAFKLIWLHYLKEHGQPLFLPDISVVLDTNDWHEDENKNRILATSQALSAVIGGCNHLIIPTIHQGKVDTFAARLNRNISHILKMESYLDRVEDPAAGSKVIEAGTEAIYQAFITDWSIPQ